MTFKRPTEAMEHITLPNSHVCNVQSVLDTGWPQGDRSGHKSSKPTEHETFNITTKQRIIANTLVSDKTASDKQLTLLSTKLHYITYEIE
jgi:hypothetical protein